MARARPTVVQASAATLGATSRCASRTNVDNNPSRAVSRRRELDSLPFRFTHRPGLAMSGRPGHFH